jgi:hypothetical protein
VVTKPKSVPDWAAAAGPAKARAPRPPRKPLLTKQRLKVGGLVLGVVVLLGGLGFGVYRLVKPETPEHAREQVHKLIGAAEYAEALQKTDETKALGEDEKKELRKEIAAAWLEHIGEPDNNNAERVEGQLAEYLERFPEDEGAKERRVRAVGLHVPPKALALADEGKYADAYALLHSRPELAGNDAARKAEDTVLGKWVGSAEALLREDKKDYRGAEKVASAILGTKSGYEPAEKVRKRARDIIRDVTQKRDERLKEPDFDGAYQVVLTRWPKDDDNLKGVIFEKWGAWADAQKADGPLADAETKLRKLVPHEARAAVVLRKVSAQRVRVQVNGLIAEGNHPSYVKAAEQLNGNDGGLLGPEERKTLRMQLGSAFLATNRKESNAEEHNKRLREMKKLLADVKEVQQEPEVEVIKADEQIGNAFQDMMMGKYAEAEAKLTALTKDPRDEKLKARVEPLLEVVRKARAASLDLMGSGVEQLEGLFAKVDKADRKSVERLHSHLLGRRIEASIATLPGKREWKDWLADCDKVRHTPSAWVLACRLECLAEMGETDRSVWERALRALRGHKAEAGAEAYVAYGRALGEWWTGDPEAAARDLMGFTADKQLPPELGQPARRKVKILDVLQAAGESARSKGPIAQPYGTAQKAGEAFGWAQEAVRLAGDSPRVPLRASLALAAWYKEPPDRNTASRLTPALVEKEALKRLGGPAEAYHLLLIHARTRDEDGPGRNEALQSYIALLEPAAILLGEKKGSAVADHLRDWLLTPLLDDEGHALVGKKPGAELDGLHARLAAGVARLLKEDVEGWAKVKGLGGSPLRVAVQLYARAAALAGTDAEKAEYLVQQGFVSYKLPNPELAKIQALATKATRLAPRYGGAHGLQGIALVLQSRTQSDLEEKMKTLREADRLLDTSLTECQQLPPDKQQELTPLLQWSGGVVCLEVANYVSKKSEKETYLLKGKAFLEAVLRVEKKNLDAWDTYGCLVEDVAWLLDRVDQYKLACDAFQKAMGVKSLGAGRTSPWLGRGRTQAKWAERLLKEDKGSKEAQTLFDNAHDDLQTVTEGAPKSVTAAEAYYWQGKIATARDKPAAADRAFKTGLAVALASRSTLWEEALLVARAELASYQSAGKVTAALETPAGAAKAPRVADARAALASADQRARDLAKFSNAQAAMFELANVRNRYALDNQYPPAEPQLRVIAGGLKDGRLQDLPYKAYLLAERAEVRYRSDQSLENLRKAFQDHQEVLDLGSRITLDPRVKAKALGYAGLVRAFTAVAEPGQKRKHSEEGIAKLREALALAPKHKLAWEWKIYLGLFLKAKRAKSTKEEIAFLQEAAKCFREAEQEMPGTKKKDFKWVSKRRKEVEEMLEELRKKPDED